MEKRGIGTLDVLGGNIVAATPREQSWPHLPFGDWSDTCATLHLWTQIVGKIRLVQSPWINHYWQATLYVTSRGLTTSPMPYGGEVFEIHFDFLSGQLLIEVSDGRVGTVKLEPQSVASFDGLVMEQLTRLGVPVDIHKKPNELAEAVPSGERSIRR